MHKPCESGHLVAIQEAESNADAIVLAGRPGSFCAGFDLATMTGGDREAIDALGKAGAHILLKLYGTGKPLVAAARATPSPSAPCGCWPATRASAGKAATSLA